MGLFKKPNRKFRPRVTNTDSDEEERPPEVEKKLKETKNTNILFSTETKEKSGILSKEGSSKDQDDNQPVIPAAKLLSFHDDEEDVEVFKLKKSNYSRRLTKQLEKERKKRSQETLTESATSTSQKFETKCEKKEESKLTKNFGDVLSGKEAEDMDVEEEDKEQHNPFKDVLQSGIIPDAATIYAMKKHRQLAREMSDVIPLEPSEKEDETQSRLVREDDNDRSDDDDDSPSRLSFNVNSGAVERQKVREAFLSVQDEEQEELEDAAELERWEREQIRKGVTISQGIPSQSQQPPENEYLTSYLSAGNENRSLFSKKDSISIPRIISETPKSKLTTEMVKARLQERLASLKEIHESHKKDLESVRKEIIQNAELIENHTIEAPENALRFQLYQQMRGYVKDLIECLDMKVAHIEVLEARIMDLYKDRSKALIVRRQQDIRDQADEYSSLSCKIMKGNISDITNDKNTTQDEVKLRRAAEREGRRIRRRKLRERTSLTSKHYDGMSSDDEERDIDIMEFSKKRDEYLLESKEIFEDVVDEFGTIQGIMLNFEKWKKDQSSSYGDAFVPLCLPKIFGPFVRIELLSWNPLEDELNFENLQWYKTLAWYGCQKEEEIINEDDPDMNLLPTIVEKTIIPKITAFVKDVWDPLSSRQTNNLVNLIKMLHTEFPSISGKSKQTQTLLQSVSTRIQFSLGEDIFIPMYPKELLENRSLGSSTFFQRQFFSAFKLLKNIIAWEGIIAERALQDMSLSYLLNRYLLMGLNTSLSMRDSLDKCKMIVSVFPKTWFSTDKGSQTLPSLKPFSQYLVRYAQSLNSKPSKYSPSHDEDIKPTVIEIVQLLITMGSLDEAVILAKEFSISGFKKEKF